MTDDLDRAADQVIAWFLVHKHQRAVRAVARAAAELSAAWECGERKIDERMAELTWLVSDMNETKRAAEEAEAGL